MLHFLKDARGTKQNLVAISPLIAEESFMWEPSQFSTFLSVFNEGSSVFLAFGYLPTVPFSLVMAVSEMFARDSVLGWRCLRRTHWGPGSHTRGSRGCWQPPD